MSAYAFDFPLFFLYQVYLELSKQQLHNRHGDV